MPVAIQSHHPHRSSGAAPARPAVGGGEQTESGRHALGELLAADRRGEFLAMVLHELGSPLSNILDGVALVRDTEGSLPQAEWLWTGLEKATRQVQGLLADLMDLCQASHPTFQLHRRPMDLASAVCRRRRSSPVRPRAPGARPRARGRGRSGLGFSRPGAPGVGPGQPARQCGQIHRAGGRVTVSVEATGAEVVLRVRDTGIGIAPEVLPFVFDPFVREGIPGVRPRRVSGVGLLLVRTLVELHGGRAEASSAGRGRGSEFVVRLPVADRDSM